VDVGNDLVSDMDNDDREALITRSLQLLEQTEGITAALAERRRINSERAAMARREWRAPEPPDPVPPLRRSPQTPRDWVSEGEWIRSIAAVEIAKLKGELIEGLGQALGRMRKEIRGEIKLAIAEGKVQGIDRVIARLDGLLMALGTDQYTKLVDPDGRPLRH
jgi:hypothetical protein